MIINKLSIKYFWFKGAELKDEEGIINLYRGA